MNKLKPKTKASALRMVIGKSYEMPYIAIPETLWAIMRETINILIIVTIFSSCGRFEEVNLIRDFKSKEDFRIHKTESHISKSDSVYRQIEYIKCFDNKGRLINESNYRFYYYDSLDRVEKTVVIFKRAENPFVKFRKYNYQYDSIGNLLYILNLENELDTIDYFIYDSLGRLIESDNGYRNESFYYLNDKLIKKVKKENNEISRVSDFIYDSIGRLKIENWVFSGNHRMKTRFEYYPDGKLFREIDSSFNTGNHPNTYVEFMDEYHYNESDSISEIIKLGRVKSESDFKIRGRIRYEYNISP
jgi:hypothetical protein